jgi:hypothetical protein
MNITYTNEVKKASLSATDVNNNFPLSNLYHRFLQLPFRSTSIATNTISIEWTEDKTIDSIFIGYHNLQTLQIKMYDSGASLLDDSGVLTFTEGVDDAYYPTKQTTVRKIEVILLTTVSSSYFEIGNITAGEKLTIDCIETPDFDLEPGGNEDKSTTGQITGVYSTELEGFSYGLINLTTSEKKLLKKMVVYNGTYKPMWIDIYPDAHIEQPPVYVNLTSGLSFPKQQGKFLYDTKLNFEECK